jgi:hypothetical protein
MTATSHDAPLLGVWVSRRELSTRRARVVAAPPIARADGHETGFQ